MSFRICAALLLLLLSSSGCAKAHYYIGGGIGGLGALGVITGASNLKNCSGRMGCVEDNGGQITLIAAGAGLVVVGAVVVYIGETAKRDGEPSEETHTIYGGEDE